MPLNQQFTPPLEVSAPPVRMDAQTQQRVIARALKLQSRQHETMTVDQLEAIAAEVGIERSFVQQALEEIAAEGAGAKRRTWERRLRLLVPNDLMEHCWALAAGFGMSAFLGGASAVDSPGLRLLTPVVAVGVGASLGSKTRAVRTGITLGLVAFFVRSMALSSHDGWPSGYVTVYLALLYAAVCGGSSLIGAFLRQWMDKRRKVSLIEEGTDPRSIYGNTSEA